MARALKAHVWDREEGDWYVEPKWCSKRLFDIEYFRGGIIDPACGMGRIVESARAAGHRATGSDIAARVDGYAVCDFFERKSLPAECANFDRLEEFTQHGCSIVRQKVAIIAPVARLNAAHWLETLPLVRIWLMTPRPSMGPGRLALQGIESRGDTKDYAWLVFNRMTRRAPNQRSLIWLHKEGTAGTAWID
jgi:hypothetical protein